MLLFYAISAAMAILRRLFRRLLRHAGDTEDVFDSTKVIGDWWGELVV